MKLGQIFVTDQLPQGGGFDPIPAGDYTAKITEALVKKTKDGTGEYINVRYDIIGPKHEGRVIFGMINISNSSQRAEEIGRQQLGNLLRAIGLPKIEDSDELLGHDVVIKVKVDPAKDGYDAKNTVTAWKAVEGGSVPKPAAVQSVGTNNKPSWMK